MMPPSSRRVSLGWSRSDRVGLVILLAAWMLMAGRSAVLRGRGLRSGIPVDRQRVQSVEEKIDPNSATVASLRRLPLIGPEKAQAIVAYRRSAGPAGAFKNLEDLQNVPGIGPGIVWRARPYVSLPAAGRSGPTTRR